jgi:hypothetical protein
MSSAHAFILGVLASWTPSAVLFALLVRYRGKRAAISEHGDAVNESKQRDREHLTQTESPRNAENVCVPFRRRGGSDRRVSGSGSA